jgi:UDP-glucoronosyl and UDP-glucosyl transferase.
MKYLFIVQGEGRGHMTQAITLSDLLRRNGHEVVAVLLGINKNLRIPSFFYEGICTEVIPFETPSFAFSKNRKKISLSKTLLKNVRPDKLKKFKDNIVFIHEQIQNYSPDAVINFFDMLPGLCNLRYREEIPFINIAHQFLIQHPDYTCAQGSGNGMMLYRLYTQLSNIGATKTLALSFYPLKDLVRYRMAVMPPLMRKEVYGMETSKGDYVLAYMVNPAFMDEILKWHEHNPTVQLHVFWNKNGDTEDRIVDETLTIHQLDNEKFLKYMAGCKAYITTAGFESVCEAAYMGKPVMMIPAHVEQHVNAIDAQLAGLGIVSNTFDITALMKFADEEYKQNDEFRKWADTTENCFIEQVTTWI